METSLFWALMFPAINLAPPQYHDACTKTQQALYQNSDAKTFSDQTTSYVTKNYGLETAIVGGAYEIGVKKSVSFKTKLDPVLPNVELKPQYNVQTHTGSVGLTIPF
jgi:hypothetical protein